MHIVNLFCLFFGYFLARSFLLARVLFCVDAFLYECVFSCVFSCTSSFLRGRFLAYEFLFACFRVCFMHESFFAWMLSCTIYFFCVFSCPGDDDLKNDGETSEDQADDQTSMNLHDDQIDKTTID